MGLDLEPGQYLEMLGRARGTQEESLVDAEGNNLLRALENAGISEENAKRNRSQSDRSRLLPRSVSLDCCVVNDKQILITGAPNGIGLAAAEALAARGANLALVGRSKTRTRIASARIRAAAAGRRATVATFIADLSSQASVRGLAAEVLARYPKLDVLVNNAGAMYGTWQLTNDGIELTW